MQSKDEEDFEGLPDYDEGRASPEVWFDETYDDYVAGVSDHDTDEDGYEEGTGLA